MCGDRKTEREVCRRAQAGANAWRSVEGVMADRRISKRLNGKAMSTCVTPACLYGTETLAMTKAARVRKQLGTKNSKSNEGRQEKNGGVKGGTGVQRSLTETGEGQATVGRTRRKDGG